MIIAIIIILFLLQILGYIYLDRNNLRYWKFLILGILLFLYGILPFCFVPPNPNHEPRFEGLFYMISGIWILGGGITIMIYLIYWLIKLYKNS